MYQLSLIHIRLLCLLQNQDQFIDAVDLELNALNEWRKCICYIVDERI